MATHFVNVVIRDENNIQLTARCHLVYAHAIAFLQHWEYTHPLSSCMCVIEEERSHMMRKPEMISA